MQARASAALLVFIGMLSPAARGDVVTITPAKDNTLYGGAQGFSNGKGDYFFAGRTALDSIMRAVIQFDVGASVPAGSTVTAVSLQLSMSKTISLDHPVSLHRLVSDWGEGDSDALGEEGQGAPAEPGDATWLHTFFSTQFWSAPGGDFASAPSATTMVGAIGFYTWSSSAMVADVQGWLNLPDENFGWAVLGNEQESASAKRFDSRDHPLADHWPSLTIEFTPPGACLPCDADCNGTVNGQDIDDFIAVLNGGAGCSPCAADADGNGSANGQDIDEFIACLSG